MTELTQLAIGLQAQTFEEHAKSHGDYSSADS